TIWRAAVRKRTDAGLQVLNHSGVPRRTVPAETCSTKLPQEEERRTMPTECPALLYICIIAQNFDFVKPNLHKIGKKHGKSLRARPAAFSFLPSPTVGEGRCRGKWREPLTRQPMILLRTLHTSLKLLYHSRRHAIKKSVASSTPKSP